MQAVAEARNAFAAPQPCADHRALVPSRSTVGEQLFGRERGGAVERAAERAHARLHDRIRIGPLRGRDAHGERRWAERVVRAQPHREVERAHARGASARSGARCGHSRSASEGPARSALARLAARARQALDQARDQRARGGEHGALLVS